MDLNGITDEMLIANGIKTISMISEGTFAPKMYIVYDDGEKTIMDINDQILEDFKNVLMKEHRDKRINQILQK